MPRMTLEAELYPRLPVRVRPLAVLGARTWLAGLLVLGAVSCSRGPGSAADHPGTTPSGPSGPSGMTGPGGTTSICEGAAASATYLVKALGDSRETIAPGTPQPVHCGATLTFTVAPNHGDVVSPSVGGSCPVGSWSGESYTTGEITADCEVSFTAAPPTGGLSAWATVTTAGGTIALSNGTSVSIPPGALSAPTIIVLKEVPDAPLAANASAVGTPVLLQPEGLQFSSPVTVTLTYDPSELPIGTQASQVAVFTAPATSTTFTPLGGYQADSTHVQAQTMHFSFFEPVVGIMLYQVTPTVDARYDIATGMNPQNVPFGSSAQFTLGEALWESTPPVIGGTCAGGTWSAPAGVPWWQGVYTTGPVVADCTVTFSPGACGEAPAANACSSGTVCGLDGLCHMPNYTDNGNGTITDDVTNLLWEQGFSIGSSSPGNPPTQYTWDSTGMSPNSAQYYCANLSVGPYGAGSWGLPTVQEVNTLLPFNTSVFSNVATVWTSTVSSNGALAVDLNDGAVLNTSAQSTLGVRCVLRSSQPTSYLVLNSGDGLEQISPGGPQTVFAGGVQSFWVLPNGGQHLPPAVGGSCPMGTWGADTYYTTGPIYSSCTVTFSETGTHLVTPSGDGNEAFVPNGVQTAANNGTSTFEVDGVTGYTVSQTVGGSCPTGSWSSDFYTTGHITADCTVVFSAATSTFHVSGTGDGNETISPSSPQTVSYGNTASFTVSPNAHYSVASTVGGTCPTGSWSGGVYTTGAIMAACSVAFTAAPSTYLVSPSGDGNETITPSAPQTVNYGSTQSFTVTANTGYTVSLIVGGTCPFGFWSGNVYTTGPIGAACTAIFTAPLNTYHVTPSGDGNETINPSGVQTVGYGLTQSFTVTANTGYSVSGVVGGTCPIGGWVGTTYTTGAITAACSVSFSANLNVYTLTSSGDGNETITPSAPQLVGYGGSQTYTATPNTGYFVSHTVGGTCPTGFWSSNTVYTTGAIVADCSVAFTAALITLNVTSSGDGNESISPLGMQGVSYGGTPTYMVTANLGYTLSSTVGGTCPAGSWDSSNTYYTTGTITGDCTVTFTATGNTYQVTPSGDGGESISPSTAQTVAYGATQTFTVTANTGYTLNNASVGGTCLVGSWAGNVYTTGAVTADCSVSFSATLNTFSVTPVGDGNETISPSSFQTVGYGGTQAFTVNANTGATLSSTVGGTCPAGSWSGSVYTTGAITANCSVLFSAPLNAYQVTPSGDGNEVITPSSVQVVNYGGTQSFTVNPSTGYTVNALTTGTCPAGSWAANIYTTGVITDDCSVVFGATLKTYAVTPSGDGHETISPSGPQQTGYGLTQAFTVTGNTGYAVSSTVGGTCLVGSWSGSTYTTGVITGACSVTFSASLITHTVTPSGDSGLVMVPGSPQTVSYGATLVFTVTPNTGYIVSTSVGGTCPAGSWAGSHYTTGAITADCSVSFSSFSNNFAVTPSGDGNEMISPNTLQYVSFPNTQSFTVTPDTGYQVSSTVGGTCPTGSWIGSVYTTGSIFQDCSVSFTATPITYVVTPSGDGNVAFSPNVPTVIGYNGTAAFTVTGNTGYTASLTVGGTCPAGSWTGSTYTTGVVSASCTVSFSGTPIPYQVTPSGDGNESFSPSTAQNVNYGSTQAFTLTPNSGYTLLTAVGGTCALGSWAGNVYTTGPVTGDCTVMFSAQINIYVVTSSGDAHETISPHGAQTVASAAGQAFTVTADTGYTNSASVGGTCPAGSWTGNVYTTGAIFANCSVVFSATLDTYQVTATSYLGYQTISPASPLTVGYGMTATFTVTPTNGIGWFDEPYVTGTCPFGTWSGNVYTSGAVTGDCSIQFYAGDTPVTLTGVGDGNETIIVYDEYGVATSGSSTTLLSGDQGHFTVTPNVGTTLSMTVGGTCPLGFWIGNDYWTAPSGITSNCTVSFSSPVNTYYVTPSGDFHESITPGVAQLVSYGQTRAFTVTANAGYTLSSVGGSCPAGSWSGSVYTTGATTGACSVSFSATLNFYLITPSGDSHETISPSSPQFVGYGSSQTFTVTAGTGYTVSNTVGGSCPAGTWANSVYSTGAITGSCSVIFSANLNRYQVIPSGDSHETYGPNTAQMVGYGSTQSFTVSPSSGYTLGNVSGSCPAGSWLGNTYTTGPIVGLCFVYFTATPNPHQVTPSGDGHESFSPSGPQTVAYGGFRSFTVTPNSGYTVVSSVGGTCAPGSWYGSVYTTGGVTADCTVSFTAALNTYRITPAGDSHETVSPSSSQTVAAGGTQAFTVVANAGYTLSSVGGSCAVGSWSGNVYTTGAITASCLVSFSATLNTYQVTPSGDSNEFISPSAPSTVGYGGTQAYLVSANTGYTLSSTVGGTCPSGSWSGQTYTTGTITSDCTVSFSASLNTFTVTPSGDSNESFSPSMAQTVGYGAAKTFTVTPNAGYSLAAVGGSCPAGSFSGNSYTTGAITANCTVSFTASLNTYYVSPVGDFHESISPGTTQLVGYGQTQSFTVVASTGYTLSASVGGTCPAGSWSGSVYTTGAITGACSVSFGTTLNTYQVSSSGDSNETISPSTTQTVNYGSTQAFTVTVATGYTLSPVVTGTCPAGSWDGTGTVYTTGAIIANCSASFSATLNTYQVIPSGDSNETFSPSTAQTVAYGNTQAFTVTSNTGFSVTSVAGNCPAGSWSGNVYTTGVITGGCFVSFIGTPNPYQVTPSGDGNETITPNTSQTVNYGSTQTFTVNASSGYTVVTTVGGTCAQGSWAGNLYSTGVITGDCSVSFSATQNPLQVTVSGGSNVNLSPTGTQTISSGSTLTFDVTANQGYTLAAVGGSCPAGSWTGSSYTTGAITANCSVAFSATLNTYQVTPSGDSNEEISPGGAVTVSYGGTQQFLVIPTAGYSVLSAVGGTCPVGSWDSSGTTYTTGTITADCSVSFSAAVNTYFVDPSGDSNESFSPSTVQTVAYGQTQAFTVTPNGGYTLSAVGGTCPAGSYSGNVYTTGAITSDCFVSFTAALNSYVVTSSGDFSETISPSSAQLVAYGMTQAYQVDPASGHTVSSTVGGTCPAGSWSGDIYTTGPITGACSVSFSATVNMYNVTPVGDSYESISPSTTQTVSYGSQPTFTVTASTGYTVSNTVGGTCPVGTWSNSVYTAGAIVGNCTVSFSATLNTYQVIPAGDSNESFSPNTAQSVGYGMTQSFTVTPNTGYSVTTVGGSCPVGSWAGNVYTTGPIIGTCFASFIGTLNQYTVTPSGDSNETISPSAPQTVRYGFTQAFTVTANSGYTVSSMVGGTCPTGSWSGSVYTTGSITGACSAVFSAALSGHQVTASGDGNETISPSGAQYVNAGASGSFTVTAMSGDTVFRTVGGTCPAGSWSGGTYNTGIVTADCSVTFSAGTYTAGEIVIADGAPASHACAVVNGAAWCWGANNDGQLGDNSTASSHVPVAVTGISGGVSQIADGAGHTCAIVNGGVQCWGLNDYGQLGNSSETSSLVPVQVTGLGSGVQAIAAGGYHTCALANGGVQCWGYNAYGSLGNGSMTSSSIPVQVTGLTSGVTAIAAGLYTTCAIVSGGLQCWGYNPDGEVGDGTTVDRPSPVQVYGLTSGVQAVVAAGTGHTCAVVNGGAQCWGINGDGELGTNSSTPSHVPVQVTGLTSGVTAIAAGQAHTCVIASGGVQCWGWNAFGQVGDNSTSDSFVPVQVSGLTSGVESIAVGDEFSCAVVNGSAQCWGYNAFGQLGNNSTTESLVPALTNPLAP